MMKIIKNITILSFVLLSCQLNAQNDNCPCPANNANTPVYQTKLIGIAFINKFIGQDKQFFNGWTKGDVYLTDSTIVKNVFLRYNGYLDELLWMRESDYKPAILDRNSILRFDLHQSDKMPFPATFIKVQMKNINHPENDDVFLQLLVEGEVNLFKKVEVTENSSNGKLFRKDFYYLKKNGTYTNFRPRRLFLYKLFPDDKKTIKHIVRSNHLMINNEPDLVRAISLYNESYLQK